jgi:cation-transporting P-type ATPase E
VTLGLTSEEARARLARAPGARRPHGTRSYTDIVLSNTFTVFNLILGVLLAVILTFGDPRDGLFGGVIVANTLIGVVQEVRAKRTLDRLSLLAAPRAHAWRDGARVDLPVEEIVVGDVLHVESGDQVVADGRVVEARALSLDESILTGESDHVSKEPGDEVLSGAYCAAGAGDFEVERVGAESFAERLAHEARGTRARPSPLQIDINRVLFVMLGVMIPLAATMLAVLWVRDLGSTETAETGVAALVPVVPEGLVLLASLTFAVAAVRLGRLGTLAQRLNAIESLASVDTICFDKTGTLTDARIRLEEVVGVNGDGERARALFGRMAACAGSRNATMNAIAEGVPGEASPVVAEVPFASSRKWSGVTCDDGETLVMGAPEVLQAEGVEMPADLADAVRELSGRGRRVVLLARGDAALAGEELPGDLRAIGLAALAEGLRPDAIDTVRFMVDQGVDLKVISGDGVGTVQAVALAAGVPGAENAISGADLPDDPGGLENAVLQNTVFGRVSPEQKQELIAAMDRRGRYTAMVGDGVNDVLALKQARLALAMGNGSQMAKGVGDLVLVTNDFATVPEAVDEGRRIIRNTHRVAKLFVAKSVYAAVLLAVFGIFSTMAYPFLPRHLTVASTLTIGIPAFWLAMSKSDGPVRREGFLRSLAAFVVPAGLIAAAAISASYVFAIDVLGLAVEDARVVATLTTTLVGLAIVVQVERGVERRKVRPWVWGMVAGFLIAIPVGLAIPPLREFFALPVPSPQAVATSLVCTLAAIALLEAVRRVPWLNRLEEPPPAPAVPGPPAPAR